MALSSPGIGSNLDVNSIVSQLMTVEQRPLTLLNRKEAGLQGKLSVLGSLKGAVAGLQSAMQGLKSIARFQGYSANVGDSSVLSASANTNATSGSHNITVANLAQQQILAAAGVISDTAALGAGTISLRVGSGATTSITIDASNNTLRGVRDAINSSGADVTASIVNDGAASPWRLVLTAKSTGAANTIAITNTLAPGEFKTALDNRSETQAALSAVLTVDGIAVTSATNTVSDAVAGVTLNLSKAGASTVTVARNTASAQSAVQAFVKAYNDVNKTLGEMTGYDAATRRAGAFQGEAMVINLQANMRGALGGVLEGLQGTITSLSQAGVSFQKDGALALDSVKLAAAFDKDFNAVGNLFAARGSSSNALLSFVAASGETKPGEFHVIITSVASQGAAGAGSAAAASTVIDGTNDALTLIVDGVASGALTVTHGTYDATGLANAINTALKSSAAFSASAVTATAGVDSGHLIITSARYGAASSVATVAGSAAGAAGFNSTEHGSGADVAGSVELNGVRSAATGIGQLLSGAADSAAEGLQVKYTGTAAQLLANSSATLNYSEGYAGRLERAARNFLDTDGPADSRTQGINTSIQSIGHQRDIVNRRLVDTERRLRAQFTALDGVVSRMNTTSTFLTQQLARLNRSS